MTNRRSPVRRALTTLRTIRVRLTLWYVGLLAVILVAFSTFLYANLARNLHQGIDAALRAQAQQVLRTLDDNQPSLTEAADQITPEMHVALYDGTGTILLAGDARQMVPDGTAARAEGAAGRQTLQTVTLANGGEARVLTVPLLSRGRSSAVLQVVRPEPDVAAALQKLLLLIALAIPLTLLLAIASGLFLAGRALNPIEHITDAAGKIEATDLSRRLNFQGGDDEIGRLAATFDHMLTRLEGAFQRQRQFTTEASHELRTPLAILMSQVDIALERPRSTTQYHQLLLSIREDASRMDELLSQMLMLARADGGQAQIACERLSLTNLAVDIVSAMEPLAEGRGVQLMYNQTDAMVEVEGDQTRLTQLLMNLIDNGLKYTSPGGCVRVSVREEMGKAVMVVADSGAGIDPEHLPHVFERFYRSDPARTREAGGTGLGLAISEWIVQAHGGDIRVVSTLGRGTTFTVHLPVAPPRVAAGPPAPAKEHLRNAPPTSHSHFIGTHDDKIKENNRRIEQ